MSKLAAIIIATALPTLALAEPLLPVPEPPPPATPGGYVTCSIASYCLEQNGKWRPQPAAVGPPPVPKPPGPERADGTNSGQ